MATRRTSTYLIILPFLVLTAFLLPPASHPAHSSAQPLTAPVVILSYENDPYRGVAERIAARENAPLVSSLEAALDYRPQTLLWVTAPQSLSDPLLLAFSRTLTARKDAPAAGIITGSTPDKAWQLYQRAGQVSAGTTLVLIGEFPSARISPGTISVDRPGQPPEQRLSVAAFQAQAGGSSYVYFNGHGGSTYLRFQEEEKLTAIDLVPLPPVVISADSCQTLRPWIDESISLAFIDQGAAAYAGFSLSPNSDYMIGGRHNLAFRYTWPEFPIGRTAQLQGLDTQRGFAYLPYYFLLGDPRISFKRNPPYQVISDTAGQNQRTILLADAPAGVIPIKVAGGAAYPFTRINTAARSERDLFSNTVLQSMDIDGDKFILYDHSGGELRIDLYRRAPWHWMITDPLLDSLDFLFLVLPNYGASAAYGLVSALAGWISLFRLIKQKDTRRLLYQAGSAALILTLLYGVYGVLRLRLVSVTAKSAEVGFAAYAAVFLVNAAAVYLYQSSSTRRGLIFSSLLPALPGITGALINLGMLGFINILALQKQGIPVYNYSPVYLSTIAAVVHLLLVLGANRLIQIVPRRSKADLTVRTESCISKP